MTTSSPVDVLADIAAASTFDELCTVVLHAARDLADADGATFVLRDGDLCFYADEDSISPLWKGQRFPIATCISGWAMLTGQVAEVRDTAIDERIPTEAYRPTFVRSLAMAPMGDTDPVGAVGVYWPRTGRGLDAAQLETLRRIADAAGERVRALDLATAPWAPNFALGISPRD